MGDGPVCCARWFQQLLRAQTLSSVRFPTIWLFLTSLVQEPVVFSLSELGVEIGKQICERVWI